jgi:hypothetical protein
VSQTPTAPVSGPTDPINPAAPEELDLKARALIARGFTVDQMWIDVRRIEPTGRPLAMSRMKYTEFDEGVIATKVRPGSFIAYLLLLGAGERGNKAEYRFDVSEELGRRMPDPNVAAVPGVLPPRPVFAGPQPDLLGIVLQQMELVRAQNNELMLKLIEKATPPAAPSKIDEFMELLKLVKAVDAIRGGGGGGAGGEIAAVIREVREGLGSVAAGKPSAAPARPAAAAVGGAAPAAPVDPRAELARQLGDLLMVGALSPSREPLFYAGVLRDALAASGANLAGLAQEPGFAVLMDELVAARPALAGHRPFLAEVVEALEALIAGPPGPAVGGNGTQEGANGGG